MGLGLSFVSVILEHHRAEMTIESEPLQGALFRVSLPLASAAKPS
jgi:signal transduction histidine kinase